MRLKLPDLTKAPSAAFDDIIPFSRTVIIRRQTTAKPKAANPPGRIVSTAKDPTPSAKPPPKHPTPPPIDPSRPDYRENEMQIQMLSRSLYQQIFGTGRSPSVGCLDAETAQRYRQSLQSHGIQPGDSATLPDIGDRLKLPPLQGGTLETHFERIARAQVQPYQGLAERLAAHTLPPMPSEWRLQPGWTHYCPNTGRATAVPFPTDTALVFDIENCVREGAAPTLACACGPTGWYSWVSESLMELRSRGTRGYHLRDLIPFESLADNTTETAQTNATPRLIVGHNVSYDRARIKEQYWPCSTAIRFLDTMSLHVCVSGVTSYQRAMLKSKAKLPAEDAAWARFGALNGLRDVHALYCPQEAQLNKEARNVFVDGTLHDIRGDFQNLMRYCAGDVAATHRVLRTVYAMFAERFPHPATLAGMLEIGMAYLPVTDGWKRYVQAAHLSYDDLNIEARRILERRANRACRLATDERWRQDIWLWDEDWSVQELKLNAGSPAKRKETATAEPVVDRAIAVSYSDDPELHRLYVKFAPLIRTKERLPKRRPLLPGYPAWYRGLCEKRSKAGDAWQPGPMNVGTGMQVTPKLLSLCWEGYPLHYVREHGWGFLVPIRSDADEMAALDQGDDDDDDDGEAKAKAKKAVVPFDELVRKCSLIECNSVQRRSLGGDDAEDAFNKVRIHSIYEYILYFYASIFLGFCIFLLLKEKRHLQSKQL